MVLLSLCDSEDLFLDSVSIMLLFLCDLGYLLLSLLFSKEFELKFTPRKFDKKIKVDGKRRACPHWKPGWFILV